MQGQVCDPTLVQRLGGTLTATYLRTDMEDSESRYGIRHLKFDVWQLSASPAAGWHFVRLHFVHVYEDQAGLMPERTLEDVIANPSFIADIWMMSGETDSAYYSPTFNEFYGTPKVDGQFQLKYKYKTTLWKVWAEFALDESGKLVCDPNRGNKLAYDTTTGKLLYQG